jgi:(2Fe-2S) ferredoxin
MRIESKAQFQSAVKKARKEQAARKTEVLVCCGTGCLANGSREVAEAFAKEIKARKLDASVGLFTKKTGCHGFCERGPLVVLNPSGVLYTKVKPSHVADILDKTVARGEILPRLVYKDPSTKKPIEHYSEVPFYKNQTRVAMRNIGHIDPADIQDALAHGAYAGLARALFSMTPEEVIAEIEKSGLRGRGGAGFATARKWKAARKAEGGRKFILCNGDEGDPGAFKDAPSWRAIPTRCWRAWSSGPSRWAPTRASSTCATSILWPSST